MKGLFSTMSIKPRKMTNFALEYEFQLNIIGNVHGIQSYKKGVENIRIDRKHHKNIQLYFNFYG